MFLHPEHIGLRASCAFVKLRKGVKRNAEDLAKLASEGAAKRICVAAESAKTAVESAKIKHASGRAQVT